MNYYFIDREIYYQNKKQEPRKIQCFNLKIKGNIATFIDEDGNDYIVSSCDILDNTNIEEFLEKAIKEYKDNEKEGNKEIE